MIHAAPLPTYRERGDVFLWDDLAEGDDLIALLFDFGDEAVEGLGFDGAARVHEDDDAVGEVVHDAGGDEFWGGVVAPVNGVYGPVDGAPAEGGGQGADMGVAGAVGRAEEGPGGVAGDAGDDLLGLGELLADLGVAEGGEVGVRHGVVADLVAVSDDAAEQVGVGVGPFACDEPGDAEMMLCQDVEYLAGGGGRAACIKGEGDERLIGAPAIYLSR